MLLYARLAAVRRAGLCRVPLHYVAHAMPLSHVMLSPGPPYAISNPPGSTAGWQGTAGSYSTEFENNVEGEVEHFDVYGEVQTLYSQVYWTRNSKKNPKARESHVAGPGVVRIASPKSSLPHRFLFGLTRLLPQKGLIGRLASIG